MTAEAQHRPVPLQRGRRIWRWLRSDLHTEKLEDPLGEQLPYNGQNAETFACIGRQGTALTLGTIDGYTRRSAGVTYHQLTDYLVQSGCWSGLVLDGGGSTTMVAKLPGSSKATVQNGGGVKVA